jgi:hypothetical protein
MDGWTLADLMIVIPERLRSTNQERLQPSLAVHQRQVADVLAIQEQQVEHEKDQRSLASVGCVLDQVEGRFPIGEHPAKFAVQVGIPRPQASDGVGDGGYFWVQSLPRRLMIFTLPASSRACMRYPSSLISCSQSGPSGAFFTSAASCGFNPGRRISSFDLSAGGGHCRAV